MSRVRHVAPATPISLGVSSCLLGEPVRYDGRHKRNAELLARLGDQFDLVPLCPEVAIGLGVPRPPIELVRSGDSLRARGVENSELDVSMSLAAYAESIVPVLAGLSGYIFKSRSPSCGVFSTPVYNEHHRQVGQETGIYAAAVRRILPALPCEEDDRLMDPRQWEKFMAEVREYHRAMTQSPPE